MAAPTPNAVLQLGPFIQISLKKHPVARNAASEAVNLHLECVKGGSMDARLGNASQCKVCKKILEKDEIVKGFPEGDGWVLVPQDELTALAADKTKLMTIVGFFPVHDADPKWFGLRDFLGPNDPTGIKPYMLLFQTMREQELGALVTYNGYGRDKVGVIYAGSESLVLADAFFPNEVRTYADQFKVPLRPVEFSPEERKLANQLIGSSLIDFPTEIQNQRDRYLDRVEELKAARRDGKALPNFEKAVAAPVGLDLIAALKASLGQKAEQVAPVKPPVKVEEKPKIAAKKRKSA